MTDSAADIPPADDPARAHVRDARAALDRGAKPEARAHFLAALKHDPDNVTALRHLGAFALEAGNMAEAADSFRRATLADPADADTYHDLATALLALDLTEEATLALDAALGIDPRHEAALYDRARLYADAGEWRQAGQRYLAIVKRNPQHFDAVYNRANILFKFKHFDQAATWFAEAAKLRPDDVRPILNLGLSYRYAGFPVEAIRCYDHVLEMEPGHAQARFMRANARLLTGDYAGGFADYEARRELPDAFRYDTGLPEWDGVVDIAGKCLLLTGEQGMGDTIMFLRFAALLVGRGARVRLLCHDPLVPWLSRAPGFDAVGGPRQAPDLAEGCDLTVPLMSLPHLLGATLDNLPAGTGWYLKAPPAPAGLVSGSPNLKVGLCWAGNARFAMDRFRSATLADLAPVLAVPGVEFYSLQVGGASAVPAGLTDLAPQLTDFAVTAGVIGGLDLVISADTAVAHAAGAMGVRTWVFLPAVNDWRWLTKRADSPWYASVHLYRQPRLGDWTAPMAAMAGDLERLKAEATGPAEEHAAHE